MSQLFKSSFTENSTTFPVFVELTETKDGVELQTLTIHCLTATIKNTNIFAYLRKHSIFVFNREIFKLAPHSSLFQTEFQLNNSNH